MNDDQLPIALQLEMLLADAAPNGGTEEITWNTYELCCPQLALSQKRAL